MAEVDAEGDGREVVVVVNMPSGSSGEAEDGPDRPVAVHSSDIRVSLDEDEFSELTSGEEVDGQNRRQSHRPSSAVASNRRPSFPRHPWDPLEPREPRPWTARPSEDSRLTAEASSSGFQLLWCTYHMHLWYALVLIVPMLVALGVGLRFSIDWLTIVSVVVLSAYGIVYVIGFLNLIICGWDCRSQVKGRTGAYCEVFLTSFVPLVTMISLIVYISVTA